MFQMIVERKCARYLHEIKIRGKLYNMVGCNFLGENYGVSQ